MTVSLIFLTLRQSSGRTENKTNTPTSLSFVEGLSGYRKPGFTLIETMLAIALIAIVMTPLMVTQGTIVQAIARISIRLQRIFFAENFFIQAQADADDQTKFSLDKKIEVPATKLAFERRPVDSKSSLAKIDNLVIDRIQASWSDENKQQKEVLIQLQYLKPQSKS